MTTTDGSRTPTTDAPGKSTPGPATPGLEHDAVTQESANRLFSTSILISAVRCTLAYIVFPWLLPLLGIAGGIGPGIGLTVGIVAIVFNLASIRRFHRADHRWKWPITALNCTVIVMLSVLAVQDLFELLA